MPNSTVAPLDDPLLLSYYRDMVELAIIFDHEIICEIVAGSSVYRWCESLPHVWEVPHFFDQLNCLNIPIEELMKVYMMSGYSLGGFADVFGREKIDRVLKKHRGKVLKL